MNAVFVYGWWLGSRGIDRGPRPALGRTVVGRNTALGVRFSEPMARRSL